MIKTISAYNAKTNFGELINIIRYLNTEVIVERYGKPVIKMIPLTTTETKSLKTKGKADLFAKWAGVWDNKDGDIIEKYAKKFRKTGKLFKTL